MAFQQSLFQMDMENKYQELEECSIEPVKAPENVVQESGLKQLIQMTGVENHWRAHDMMSSQYLSHSTILLRYHDDVWYFGILNIVFC